jgi:hypothetical protein
MMALMLLAMSSHAFSGEAGLDIPVFELKDLSPGLKGEALTVIRGTKIEKFDVEIIELIPDGGFDGGPLILAHFTGEVVDHSNGIAAGYSGSPVYIDGKLLGAVSAAIPFTDTHVGGITPIGSMMAALPDADGLDFGKNTVLPATDNSGVSIDEDGNIISYVETLEEALAFNDQARRDQIHAYAAVEATTPVFVSGVSSRVLGLYEEQIKQQLGTNLELINRPTGSASGPGLFLKQNSEADGSLLLTDEISGPPLKPGDAVAASLVTGDIEMQAIGTVTYSDDQGRFLMFGHPFFQAGPTNMPISKAYITWTYTSLERAFKEGVRLEPTLGTMTKDQSAACGGTFKFQPDMIPVKVKIKDIDTGESQDFNYEVFKHPDWTPMLLAMSVNQAAAEVLDRQPKGTMKLSYHVEATGLKEPLRRQNYYSNDMDVISDGAFDIMPLANLLQNNIYRDVDIAKVQVMMEITRNRINASIDNAEIINDKTKDAAADTSSSLLEDPVSADGESELLNGNFEPSQQQPGEEQNPEDNTDPMMGNMMFDASLSMENVPTFAPGETIRVKVKLQPYRTDPVWREFKLTVPTDFPSGNTSLIVHGGGDLVSMAPLGGKGRSLFGMGPILDITKQDFDDILDQIMEWPTNNELLVTLVRPFDPSMVAASLAGDDTPDEKFDAKYQMEWVIYNGFQMPVIIASKEEQAAREEGAQQSQPNGKQPSQESGTDGLLEQKRRNLEHNSALVMP